ncbi:MAG: TIGR01777 family oxidoreductase [Gammaproteobacteria bacterium]|nr:TIGR01777 family oxidoreductase [Gammaproteobacteria bacterium]
MKILMTGGTGLIGSRLIRMCRNPDHEITVLSRNPDRVVTRFGGRVQAMGSLEEWAPERVFDAVINLAGAPIATRWTDQRKKVLWDSRVTLTEKLVRRISLARTKPAVLVSGSAVGYYGDTGEVVVDENTGSAKDFGARLCSAWERAARQAEDWDVRVCTVRTGLVLSGQGGMLKQMLWPFRLGMGARLGDGGQWMSWIHIDDHIDAVLQLMRGSEFSGAYNLTAPNPVSNAEFTRVLGAAVHRPAFLVAPQALIRFLLGESAGLLLGGQKVRPARLAESGFRFKFDCLDDALADLVR